MQHAREVGRERFGREVRHVLLLHANRLNADHLDRLLEILARDGARFVPLETALADPIYAETTREVRPLRELRYSADVVAQSA